MNLTVSPQMRIVALVGLIAVLGIAVSVTLVSRNRASSQADQVAVPGTRATNRPEAPAAKTSPGQPASKTATPSKPQVAPAVAAALKAGLPLGIAQAFADKDVVVVALYSGAAPIDRLAYDEAAAGAQLAGAAFMAIDVIAGENEVMRALATELSVLEAPTVLVFARPGKLSTRIEGFADHETVAQAAANAAPA